MPLKVAFTLDPPTRLEGGGFKIKDIFSRLKAEHSDPFLMWHELPRAFHGVGDFPGAPRHPHRGFMECPYMREITAKTGTAESTNTAWAGGKERVDRVVPGSFELGKVGIGIEHEMLTDERWSGYLHGFQLWVNLPAANKFDAPHFQTASPSALPVVSLPEGSTARLLHGSLAGKSSPTQCDVVEWEYFDFEILPSSGLSHEPPASMLTRMAYVYRGSCTIGSERVRAGMLAVLEGEGPLGLRADAEGCGFLWIAGRPIGEPIVSHGPFVMSSQEQIRECFRDFQTGKLCRKPLTTQVYQ